jgi:ArsR family transcriptional regulator
MKSLSNDVLEVVAERFKVLAEPVRLQILQCVGCGEKMVGEITAELKASQPNVSKHCKVMLEAGVLARRQEKNNVYYRVSDRSIFNLCDMVCGALKKQIENQAKILSQI